ncbi:DNA polymerase IV [Alkalibacter rhizosphaerae]|uniref:DNA polymerase IV n=2 Tax=Alkalibacter rhizosphaerae TaxID=2815577 RepID=A0A974XH05_9FIRM|nr:DNA polymerase IV [Alkalibacter rhizosphaerae]
MLNPSLRGKAVAVCGSTQERHGIVLAKSELAKKAGIKTGMVNWEARQKCPDLIVVPPQYDQYLKYSKLTQEIYRRFTDKVEPFGMDECWLDVTESVGIFGSGMDIAREIKETVKKELGLTVSIGLSFNKIFAKLGSDMKKPDAITVVDEGTFREKVWPLPVDELIYVGRSTRNKLAKYGICTIGQLARADAELLQRVLGKNGIRIWIYANGRDISRVMETGWESPVKSIGHGITCTADLKNDLEVWKVLLELSQDVGHRLRTHELCAGGVELTVKDSGLHARQFQTRLAVPTQSPMEIGKTAKILFEKNHHWEMTVRAVTVRAINLMDWNDPRQIHLLDDMAKRQKQERLEDAVEEIRRRFGKRAVHSALLMGDIKIPDSKIHQVVLPGMMHE